MPEIMTINHADCGDKDCPACALVRVVNRQGELLKKQAEKIESMEPIVEAALRAFKPLDTSPDAGKNIVNGCIDLNNEVKRYRERL